MREIKFRGKRKDTGEWVFGNYIKRNLDGIPQYYIYDNQWDETEIDGYCDDDDAKIYLKDCFIEVIPETVGQFTGLFDKTARKFIPKILLKAAMGEYGLLDLENSNIPIREMFLKDTDIMLNPKKMNLKRKVTVIYVKEMK